MFFITTRMPISYKQITLDELLFSDDIKPRMFNPSTANTKTIRFESIPYKYTSRVNTLYLISLLSDFNKATENLRTHEPRSDLYRTFYIPKHDGRPRRIDAPNDSLMAALKRLKQILEEDFGCLYHTSAFAYVKHRCTVDAVKKHQANESKWFGKYDLHDFFGSTTLEFVMKMLSMIYPISEVVEDPIGKEELEKAISLGFLNGGLPQGTPLSPTLTNIMMIPIDHILFNTLKDFNRQRYIYTRYADDFLISSRYEFDPKEIEKLIVDTLRSFDAPFTLNQTKTRYGSSSGRNWNLGVMLTKDNKITVGHKRKREFKAMLNSYILDKKNGHPWEIGDVRVLDGYRSYYSMIEKDVIDDIISRMNTKYEFDIIESIREDLTPEA